MAWITVPPSTQGILIGAQFKMSLWVSMSSETDVGVPTVSDLTYICLCGLSRLHPENQDGTLLRIQPSFPMELIIIENNRPALLLVRAIVGDNDMAAREALILTHSHDGWYLPRIPVIKGNQAILLNDCRGLCFDNTLTGENGEILDRDFIFGG